MATLPFPPIASANPSPIFIPLWTGSHPEAVQIMSVPGAPTSKPNTGIPFAKASAIGFFIVSPSTAAKTMASTPLLTWSLK